MHGSPAGCLGRRHAGRARAGYAALLIALGACSASEGESITPYPLGQALVFGQASSGQPVSVSAGCGSSVCQAVLAQCGAHAYADVVLDTAGNVADVICYRGDLAVRELGAGPVATLDGASDVVFVFDSVDDGPDVPGDLVIDGENVILYGGGADLSLIGGRLRLDGDGAIVRGMSIQGDVTIDKNDVQLSLVEIGGALTVNGNNATIAESIVHGGVHIIGTEAVLVRNLFEGESEMSGIRLTCNQNQRFDDEDDDGAIDDAELGAEVSCR